MGGLLAAPLAEASAGRGAINELVADFCMQLDTSDWPDVLDRELADPALREFLNAAGAHLDEFELIVTSRFDEVVREHLSPELAALYSQTRGEFGEAMAKTMMSDDGLITAIFDVRLFLRDAPSPLPTFRHEGFHVALYRFDEATILRVTRLSEQTESLGRVVGVAAMAVEEYRVQRAVFDTYSTGMHCATFSATCEAAADSIANAMLVYANDPTPGRGPLAETVLRSLEGLAVQTAYVAAEVDAHGLDRPELSDLELHNLLLGVSWADLVGRLRTLPAANERFDDESIDRAVGEVTILLDAWLAQLGFEFEALADGNLRFDVPGHRAWLERALRGT